MCAYNRVNGQPACASDFLLGDQLKSKWGFPGLYRVGLRCHRGHQRGHHFTETLAQAAAVSMKQGVDNDCADFSVPTMDRPSDYDRYADAVKQGLVSEKVWMSRCAVFSPLASRWACSIRRRACLCAWLPIPN